MFAALALALAVPSPPPAELPARPALYSIRDSDTTIYIFGTFHVLDPSIRWFGGNIEQAFDSAGELVVETLPPDLKGAPSDSDRAAIGAALPAASFLASSEAAVHAGQDQGMSLQQGADMVLLRDAAAAGKSVEPLETLQSQFHMLSSLPESPPGPATPAPHPAVAGPGSPAGALAETMAKLQAAWAAGDQGVFAAMLTDMRTSAPTTYRVMFVERNARWADWIAARMREPGTVFVAVGAGHLAGPDSLLVRLAQRGLVSRRVLDRD